MGWHGVNDSVPVNLSRTRNSSSFKLIGTCPADCLPWWRHKDQLIISGLNAHGDPTSMGSNETATAHTQREQVEQQIPGTFNRTLEKVSTSQDLENLNAILVER